MTWGKILFYFFVGGSMVCGITYLGSRGQSFWASFVAVFPTITFLTFISVFKESGTQATVSYAKGLIYLTPAWIAYMVSVIWLLPRRGLSTALSVGIGLYLLGSLLTKKLFLDSL